MNTRITLAAFCIAATSLLSNAAFGQASVSENESSTIYVDASHGVDSYAGTGSQPVASISAAVSKAVANNARGIGTKIVVSPGTYREAISISARGTAPITIQASSTGSSYLSGSDVVGGWSHSYGSVYTHSFPYSTFSSSFGACPRVSGIYEHVTSAAFQKAMVFVNGNALTQVYSTSALRAGTFFADSGSKLVRISPPNGTNMGSARVEVASRPSVLSIYHGHNVTIRGMVFTHANSCINKTAATVTSSSYVTFDHDQAVWNNWGGIGSSSNDHVTIQNSVASHNGGIGFTAYRNTNLTFNYDQADYNNWRGASGNFHDYGMGGLKMLDTHTGTVNNFYASHNQAQGLWLDTDNTNVTISGAHLNGNTYTNVQIEANQGPVRLQNSVICSGHNGINVLESENFSVTGTKFYNNGGSANTAEFFLGGNPGGRTVSDYQSHRSMHLYSQNISLQGNVFEDATGSQYVFATYLGASDWNRFRGTLRSNGNQFYDPTKTAVFDLTGHKRITLSGWRSTTGQDSRSWSSPTSAAKAACNF
ncbi:MAG: right-handed parallel beta-helix repeat-containing protein [Acidobacteriaceae bacterium]